MENPNRTTLTVALVTGTGAPRRGGFAGPLAYVSCCEEQGPILFHKSEAREAVEALLQSDSLIVGHDVAFDLGVLATCWPDLVPLIFDAYRSNRVTDIMLREKLLHSGLVHLIVMNSLIPTAWVLQRLAGSKSKGSVGEVAKAQGQIHGRKDCASVLRPSAISFNNKNATSGGSMSNTHRLVLPGGWV